MTAPQFDWADDLAITIITEAHCHQFKTARELIANRLRAVRAAGAVAQLDELDADENREGIHQ